MINMSTTTSPVPGKIGQALQFNGTNSTVVPASVNYVSPGAPFTYSAWLQLNNFSDGQYQVSIKLQDSGGNPWEVFYSNDTTFGFAGIDFGSASGWVKGFTNATAPIGPAWHLLTITYNGSGQGTLSNFTLYLDGVSQPLSSAPSFASRTNSNLIGDDGGGNVWNGKIDDVRIYNRALSPQQVLQLYHLGTVSVLQ